jgi:ketosteroid isomerase-like protein
MKARTGDEAVNTAAEEIRVRDVINQFFDLAQKRDWNAAAALLADDFEIYSDEATSFDKKTYVALWKEIDEQIEHMELREMEVRVSKDGQMAWSKYKGIFNGKINGKPHNVETAETLILSNGGSGWKINRAHACVKDLP